MPGVAQRTVYQRRRDRRVPLNNSLRRTYDLLRFSLHNLEPDSRLVEGDLVESLSASRSTVRSALQLLAERGLVTRGPKIGTIVGPSMVLRIDEALAVDEFSRSERLPLVGRVLETVLIPAPEMIRAQLELPADALVLIIDGVLVLGDEPFALTVSYVAVDPGDVLVPPVHEVPDAVTYLEERLGVCVGESSTTVGAETSDSLTATLLGVSEGSPVLWLEDLLRDVDARPRALCQYRFRGDRVAFTSELHRMAPARPSPPT